MAKVHQPKNISKILLIALFLLFGTFMLLWLFYLIWFSLGEKLVRPEVPNQIEISRQTSQSPYVVNVPNTELVKDQNYSYHLVIADSDTPEDEIILKIVEGPDWLKSTGHTIYGVPEDVGQFFVVLSISDGDNIVYKRLTLNVRDHD